MDNHSYNQYNNNTDDTDAYTQTSADRYLDNGNVEYTTAPMSAGENLATNNSAEIDANADSWPDEWNKYQETGKSAYFYWSTTSKFGDHSLGTGDTTGWAIIMNTRAVAYDSSKTYVISGFIKTTDLSAKTAYIKADCYNAGGAWLGEVNSPLTGGTTDWTRVQAVLDQSSVPAGTAKFYASVARGAATGYARFDGIQVEVGTVQSTYNMVENASFELDSNGDRLPDKWEKKFTLASNEGRDTTFKYAGAASFKRSTTRCL